MGGRIQTSAGSSKRRSASLLGLRCGCKDSKSVSVSESSPPPSSDAKSSTATPITQRADTLTLTSSSTSASFSGEDTEAAPPELSAASLTSTPSFSGLLHQLNELEQDVISWGRCTPPPPPSADEEKKKRRPRHQRSSSEGGGAGRPRVAESVAVVKETEDPLGEFRRSMLQMIVEKEIVDGEELRELLHRFLALNSPHHHSTIVRAFAEIWEEVFSGYENTPDLLVLPRRRHSNPPPTLPVTRRP